MNGHLLQIKSKADGRDSGEGQLGVHMALQLAKSQNCTDLLGFLASPSEVYISRLLPVLPFNCLPHLACTRKSYELKRGMVKKRKKDWDGAVHQSLCMVHKDSMLGHYSQIP